MKVIDLLGYENISFISLRRIKRRKNYRQGKIDTATIIGEGIMSSPKFDRAFGNLSEAVKPHGARVSALLSGDVLPENVAKMS